VDKVLQNFQQMRGFMQQMTRGGGMPGMGGFPGMGMPGMGGGIPGMGGPARGGGGMPKAPKPAKKRKGFGEL
jgi:signal recognition particle subunit SRP54